MGEVLESLLAVLGESLELEGRPGLLDDVGRCRKMLEDVGSIANLRHFVFSVEVMCAEGHQERHAYYANFSYQVHPSPFFWAGWSLSFASTLPSSRNATRRPTTLACPSCLTFKDVSGCLICPISSFPIRFSKETSKSSTSSTHLVTTSGILRAKNWTLQRSPSDGHCQFHAVGYAVNESHQRVRANALQWMKDHREDCEAFVLQARWRMGSAVHRKQMNANDGSAWQSECCTFKIPGPWRKATLQTIGWNDCVSISFYGLKPVEFLVSGTASLLERTLIQRCPCK